MISRDAPDLEHNHSLYKLSCANLPLCFVQCAYACETRPTLDAIRADHRHLSHSSFRSYLARLYRFLSAPLLLFLQMTPRPSFRSMATIVAFALASMCVGSSAGRAELRRRLLQHRVLPDMIGSAPMFELRVQYPSGVEAKLGEELTPTAVRYPPAKLVWPTQRQAHYTLLMVDLDATVAPKDQAKNRSETLHWGVVNIPGNDLRRGETFSEYIGVTPTLGSGAHRYVFVVYKQAGKVILAADQERSTSRSMSGRAAFKTRDFATEHKLYGPIASNFFIASYDSHVPILLAQLAAGAPSAASSASSLKAKVNAPPAKPKARA